MHNSHAKFFSTGEAESETSKALGAILSHGNLLFEKEGSSQEIGQDGMLLLTKDGLSVVPQPVVSCSHGACFWMYGHDQAESGVNKP